MKFIIVGKAASGKDYLLNKLKNLGYTPMKQYTTREVRETETGDEYHFIDEETYRKMEDNHRFISSNFYHIGWYGIDIDELTHSNVAILSPANVRDIFSSHSELRSLFTIIYLDTPLEVRRKRLNNRYKEKVGDDNERRITADEKDFKDFFDYNLRLETEQEVKNFINNLSPLWKE